jgi:lipopolysaccharide export system permease protein
MYPLVVIAVLFSILLFVISFGAMPQSKQLYASFKHVKKEEMAFNVIPEELGQKFGKHYIYIEGEKDGLYQKMVIYNQDKNNSDQIFSANSGDIEKKNGIFSLTLNDGKGYTFTPDTVQQIDYDKLQVFDALSRSNYNFEEIGKYWQRASTDDQRKRRMLFFIFVSLMPLLSIYIVASFAIINPRYQKNRSFVIIGSTLALFYSLASILNKVGTTAMVVVMVVLSGYLGYWLFQRTASRYF